MNFRGLAISKRLILTWLLIIAIDLLAGLFFFHLTYNREDIVVGYSILFTAFWSAIAGIIFLFISNTRQLGICLLLNIFVVYFIFDLLGYCGNQWYEHWVKADDIKYEIKYNGEHQEILLYAQRHADYFYRRGADTDYYSYFIVGDDYSYTGHYQTIAEDHYILIFDTPDRERRHCRDSLIIRNDYLYGYYPRPLKIVKKPKDCNRLHNWLILIDWLNRIFHF